MKQNKVVLMIAVPGPLRDSLNLFLRVLPEVDSVVFASDAPSARRAAATYHPALVVLDMGLPEANLADLVRWIGRKASNARFLVLADDLQQQQEMATAGADAVVVKGHPAAQLFQIITDLLEKKDDPSRATLVGPLPRAQLELAQGR
jgi:DNA-binding NarL/FixJ family response regulator